MCVCVRHRDYNAQSGALKTTWNQNGPINVFACIKWNNQVCVGRENQSVSPFNQIWHKSVYILMVCQASITSQTLAIFDMLLCVDLASPTVSLMASLKSVLVTIMENCQFWCTIKCQADTDKLKLKIAAGLNASNESILPSYICSLAEENHKMIFWFHLTETHIQSLFK